MKERWNDAENGSAYYSAVNGEAGSFRFSLLKWEEFFFGLRGNASIEVPLAPEGKVEEFLELLLERDYGYLRNVSPDPT